jgi:hypothetical protein
MAMATAAAAVGEGGCGYGGKEETAVTALTEVTMGVVTGEEELVEESAVVMAAARAAAAAAARAAAAAAAWAEETAEVTAAARAAAAVTAARLRYFHLRLAAAQQRHRPPHGSRATRAHVHECPRASR